MTSVGILELVSQFASAHVLTVFEMVHEEVGALLRSSFHLSVRLSICFPSVRSQSLLASHQA